VQYIPIIVDEIAELKGIKIEEVAEATTKNALELFQKVN
jgi:Tat protein secretion system quality control protein TatD with DNase activity